MRRFAKTLVSVGLVAAAALALGAAPAAAESCAQKVIDDWYDNGRVDDVYAIRCYRAALKALPSDVRAYSDAPDEINRALQDAIRKERETLAPTTPPPETGGVAATTSNPNDEGPPPPATTDQAEPVPATPPPSGPPSPPAEPPSSPPGAGGDKGGPLNEAIKNLGPGSADSIPVPLIIVGALAFLLLAAGSAGLVARKLQERRLRAERADESGPGSRR